jgi:hypothetical protein
VNHEDTAALAALARIGISVMPCTSTQQGWGWTGPNDKIIRDWTGPYPAPTAALGAALAWLLEHARKGLFCHYTYQSATGDATARIDLSSFKPRRGTNLN